MITPDRIVLSPNATPGKPVGLGVVIHATRSGVSNNPNELQGTINWFLRRDVGLSAHWVVGPNGEKVRMVPDTMQAIHAGEHNATHWGIEVCQGVESDGFAEAQYEALEDICIGYVEDFGVPVIHVLDSSQKGFIGHEETAQGIRQGKSDPGRLFDWTKFISSLTIPEVKEEDDLKIHFEEAVWFAGREFGGGDTIFTMQARTDFNLPKEAKGILIQPSYRRGAAEFFHADSDAIGVVQGDSRMVVLTDEGTCQFTILGTKCIFNKILCLGYYT